ncbi:hypothetical protein PYCCODRAFT_1377712, partial [Trametes coccinea BRFM310]
MPQPRRNWGQHFDNPLIAEQLNYDTVHEQALATQQIPQLNRDQRNAFERIVTSVQSNAGDIFFVNGPGGTGKTFLYKTVCHKLRAEGMIILCVASSGIASLLLPGGRTAHSRFKIPVENLHNESTCNISKE